MTTLERTIRAFSRSQHCGGHVPSRCCYRWVLILLFLVGVFVRMWGVGFRHATWDEEQIVGGGYAIINGMYALFTGHDHPRLGYREIVSIYGIFGKYLAILPCMIASVLRNWCPANVLARIVVSLLPSIATLYLVDRLCRLLSDSKALRVGALAVLAVAFKHVETAHFAVADSLSAFVATACLLYLMRWCMQPARKADLVICALLAAVGASTRINVGGCLVLTIALTIVAREWIQSSRLAITPLLIAGTTFVLAFLLINIPYILHWRLWLEVLTTHLGEMDNIVRWHCLYYLCMTPALGMGGGIAAVVLLGLLVSLKRRYLRIVYPLVLYVLIFYIFLSLSNCAVHRWIIPMIPVLAVFGGVFVDCLHSTLCAKLNLRTANTVVAGVLFTATLPAAYHVALFDLNLTERDTTYLQVARFVNSHGPAERWVGQPIVHFGMPAPYDLDMIKDSQELDSGRFDYAILDDFVHPLHWPFPELLLRFSEKQQDTNRLVQYIRTNWQLVAEYKSKYYTSWADGIARQNIFWIYRRPPQNRTKAACWGAFNVSRSLTLGSASTERAASRLPCKFRQPLPPFYDVLLLAVTGNAFSTKAKTGGGDRKTALQEGSEIARWLAWAERYANRHDPLAEGNELPTYTPDEKIRRKVEQGLDPDGDSSDFTWSPPRQPR